MQRRKEASHKIISKKEEAINTMSNQQILIELKDKQLPVYGTNQEKRDRLKKFHNIQPSSNNLVKKSTRSAIQELADQREERRRRMEEVKLEREKQAAFNEANGIKCDVDF